MISVFAAALTHRFQSLRLQQQHQHDTTARHRCVFPESLPIKASLIRISSSLIHMLFEHIIIIYNVPPSQFLTRLGSLFFAASWCSFQETIAHCVFPLLGF
uniref:Uncharacterized protein n=1 Tax=Octactis speculum TaxID=3111310 RepID=A0A7S2MIU3_9STRA